MCSSLTQYPVEGGGMEEGRREREEGRGWGSEREEGRGWGE